DLDWDRPPLPARAKAAVSPLPPMQVVGEIKMPAGRRADELAELNRKLEADPEDAEALWRRGRIYLQAAGKRGLDSADLKSAAALRPDLPEVHRLLGDALQLQGDVAGAIAAFGKHLELHPADDKTRLQRGGLYLRQKQPQPAVEDFDRILKDQPDHEAARY